MSKNMENGNERSVRMIPVEKIKVINPRTRNKRKFAEIVSNIRQLGLKRPITVRCCKNNGRGEHYELVCGQGRLEAMIRLGQSEVPAIVIDASYEECLIMSLVENIARPGKMTMESVRQLSLLRDRGYSVVQIAKKVGLESEYIRGLLRLYEQGETRLIHAVNKGQIPISMAVEIAKAEDEEVQRALTEAYEKKLIRGKALIKARRIIESRQQHGKGTRRTPRKKGQETTTSASIVRAYTHEYEIQQLMVKKAGLCERRLMFVTGAFRKLLGDENFINLLRAEGLETLPRLLAELLKKDR